MLTTETEARTKACQEAFAAEELAVNGVHEKTANSGNCLGSACMAWRWGKLLNVYTPTGDTTFTLSQELGGYCGKAGKPVQLDWKDAE